VLVRARIAVRAAASGRAADGGSDLIGGDVDFIIRLAE